MPRRGRRRAGRCSSNTSKTRSRSRMSARTRFGIVEQCPTVDREHDGVQGTLVALQEDQLGGLETHQLAAQLAADGSAGTGHEDALSGDVRRNGFAVDVGRLATEQVAFAHRADVADPEPVDDRVHARQHEQAEPGSVGDRVDRTDDSRSALGMASRTSRAPKRSATSARSAIVPRTRTPETENRRAGVVVVEQRDREVRRTTGSASNALTICCAAVTGADDDQRGGVIE